LTKRCRTRLNGFLIISPPSESLDYAAIKFFGSITQYDADDDDLLNRSLVSFSFLPYPNYKRKICQQIVEDKGQVVYLQIW
jgi:hypothetical protein